MGGQIKSLIIGFFVIIALALLAWTVIWVRPSVGDEGQTLYVRFTNIDKVMTGTRVLFAGQPIGEVAKISEVQDARIDAVQGKVYIYQLTLKVDSDVEIYTTDQFTIRTSGLLGERAVDILPRSPQPGKPFEKATSQDILYASMGGSVEETFNQINSLTTKAEGVLNTFDRIFNQLDETQFWDNVSRGAENFSELAETINRPKEINEIIDNVHVFSADLKKSWEKVDGGLEDLTQASKKFSEVADLAKNIFDSMEKGEGSIGKLLMRDDFYLQMKGIMTKVDILVDDLNQFGLLYHTDKKWQRKRSRKTQQLQELCSPQQFDNYFNHEMKEIFVALNRLNHVLEEAKGGNQVDYDYFSCKFQQVFAELLRKVIDVESILKQYNAEFSICEMECH